MSAMLPAFRAELVRTRRTVGVWLILAGLAICGLQAVSWATVATRDLRRWDQLLDWQTGYVTGMAGPLAALVAALAVRREKAARSGGTLWRAVPPRYPRASRIGVIALQLLGLDAAVVLPMAAVGAVAGLGQPPIARVLLLVLTAWAGTLPLVVVSLVLAERLGMFVAVAIGVAWQVAGTLEAESAQWWLLPFTWSVRPALPLLRIHANGVAAAPGDPVLTMSPGVPPLLAAGLFVVLLLGTFLLPSSEPRVRRRRPVRNVVRPAPAVERLTPTAAAPGRRHSVLAAAISFRRTALIWAVPAVIGCLLAVFVLWNGGYVRGLFGLLIIPGASCVSACLVAATQAPALRTVLIRASAARWCGSMGLMLMALWLPIVVATGLLSGGGYGLRMVIVGAFLGIGLLAVNLWLAFRFGIAASVGTTVVATVISVIFGASGMEATSLWLLGPWSWGYSALRDPGRIAVAVTASIAVTAVTVPLWIRASKRLGRQ